MAVWQSLPRPIGGSVSALTINAKGLLLAGTLNGVFTSRNIASDWVRTGTGPRVVLSIAAHPADPNMVFAGSPDGVYRSRDGGGSWRPVLASPPVTAIAAAGDGVVLAATEGDGIFRSANDGVDWEPANAGLLDLDVSSLALVPGFRESGLVYAGTASGLYRSVNGGRSWRGVDLPGARDDVQITAIAASFDFGTDLTVFVATEYEGLLRSCDGGATWAEVAEAGGGGVTALAARKNVIAAAFGERVWVSTDNRQFETLPSLPAPALALTFADDRLVAGMAGLGVHVLSDGRWGQANDGLGGVHVVRLAHTGSELAALAADGAIHARARGGWSADFGIRGSSVTDIVGGRGELWALAGGRLFISSDGAGSWRDVPLPDGLEPTAIAASESGKAIVGCADGSVALATGDQVVSLGRCSSGRVMRIAAAGASIVAATQSGDTAIVWRAGDPALAELMRFEGVADVPLTVGDSGVSVLAVAAYQDRIVTGDLHAVEPELGLVDVAPATVRSLSARGASIFAATDVGLLASHDGGKSFAADLTPHAPANLTALCVHGDDVYVADATGGLWIRRSA